MRNALLVTLLSSFVVSVAGCGQDNQACTTEARVSLRLSVVDAETGEGVDATVTYLVDGEQPSGPPEKTGVGQYHLGFEEEGTFEVSVSADGYESVMREYEVTSDECHVMTVDATIELAPSP